MDLRSKNESRPNDSQEKQNNMEHHLRSKIICCSHLQKSEPSCLCYGLHVCVSTCINFALHSLFSNCSSANQVENFYLFIYLFPPFALFPLYYFVHYTLRPKHSLVCTQSYFDIDIMHVSAEFSVNFPINIVSRCHAFY